jgi:hypothetical protein
MEEPVPLDSQMVEKSLPRKIRIVLSVLFFLGKIQHLFQYRVPSSVYSTIKIGQRCPAIFGWIGNSV